MDIGISTALDQNPGLFCLTPPRDFGIMGALMTMPPNILPTSGNLLNTDAQALVNPVNCVGVMGKGLALQFKQAFPQNYAAYRAACGRGEVQPGRMFVTETGLATGTQFLINFPTKRDWRQPSRLEDIETGLTALVAEVQARDIRSLALPALGCGLGGLDWNLVRPLILDAFAAFPDVRVLLYGPQERAAGEPK